MRAEPRLAVAEHAGAFGAQPIACGDDIVDLVANMVHSSDRIAVEKTLHWRARAEWFEKLDLRILQFDEDDRDAVYRHRTCLGDTRPKHLAIDRARRCEIRHDDRYMVEPADHAGPSNLTPLPDEQQPAAVCGTAR